MLRTIHSSVFFSDKRPPGIPSDTITPDLDNLIERTKNLDSSGYSLKTLRDILHRENTRLEAGSAALKFIQSIDRNTVFVAGGQQAGLLVVLFILCTRLCIL